MCRERKFATARLAGWSPPERHRSLESLRRSRRKALDAAPVMKSLVVRQSVPAGLCSPPSSRHAGAIAVQTLGNAFLDVFAQFHGVPPGLNATRNETRNVRQGRKY